MDLESYLEQIEEAIRDPAELERIRAEAQRHSELEDSDKQFISGRVATYLADHDRQRLGR